MNIQHLGSQYGGWVIDINSIKDGDTIICGGIGEDISFEEELMKHKNINVIEVDPTEKSHIFIKEKIKIYPNITLLKCAIEKDGIKSVKLHKNKKKEYVSESVFIDHSSVNGYDDSYITEVISLKKLIKQYNPSYVKIDIEGSEYNVYEELYGVPQISIEFHHHCILSKSLSDTHQVLKFFTDNGYVIINNRNFHEVTLLKIIE
jgi:FkbM family methyltransferase